MGKRTGRPPGRPPGAAPQVRRAPQRVTLRCPRCGVPTVYVTEDALHLEDLADACPHCQAPQLEAFPAQP